MLEGFAEYYSADLSQKVKRGIKENVRKGLSFGGSCPYGYTIVNKRYTINEIQRPYVIKIFQDYAAGRRQVDIFNDLNTAPDFAGKGVKWNKSSLNRMLTNKKYIGLYETQGLTVTDAIPAIIDEELFNKVQSKLIVNKHRPGHGKAKVSYSLSGKLFCGNCGKAVTGTTGTSKTGLRYHYYKCKTKGCGKRNRKDALEKLIVDATTNYVLVPDNFDDIAHRCIEIYKKEQNTDNMLESLEKQMNSITNKINNIMKAIEAGIITETTKERLTQLEQDRLNVDMEIISIHPHSGWFFFFGHSPFSLAAHKCAFYWPASHATFICYP